MCIFLSAAPRLQLHSGTMRLQVCLPERKKYRTTLGQLTPDRTLVLVGSTAMLYILKTGNI